MKTLNIHYQTDFEISFSNTFDTFKILYIFHVLVMGKLECLDQIAISLNLQRTHQFYLVS